MMIGDSQLQLKTHGISTRIKVARGASIADPTSRLNLTGQVTITCTFLVLVLYQYFKSENTLLKVD